LRLKPPSDAQAGSPNLSFLTRTFRLTRLSATIHNFPLKEAGLSSIVRSSLKAIGHIRLQMVQAAIIVGTKHVFSEKQRVKSEDKSSCAGFLTNNAVRMMRSDS
jgi:hypothetical protein